MQEQQAGLMIPYNPGAGANLSGYVEMQPIFAF